MAQQLGDNVDPQFRAGLDSEVRMLLTNSNGIALRVQDMLSNYPGLESFQPFTMATAMGFILENGLGTDCVVNGMAVHKAVLVMTPGYFQNYLQQSPDVTTIPLPFGALSNLTGPKAIEWLIRYLYHPDVAGMLKYHDGFLNRNDRKTLPCCVEALRLGKIFQYPNLEQYAVNTARQYVDEKLHRLFKAVAKHTGPPIYMEGEIPVRERAVTMGARPAIAMLAPPGLAELNDEYSKQMLRDIVLLVIGLKHRIRGSGESINKKFKDSLQGLSKSTSFRKLYLDMDVDCPAFRVETALPVKSNQVTKPCACPNHFGTQKKRSGKHSYTGYKRAHIVLLGENSNEPQPYILLNPFDGADTMYCWDCAGINGYPWRHEGAPGS